MADATLTDVVKKLQEVKSAVTAGEVATGTEASKAAEAAAEATACPEVSGRPLLRPWRSILWKQTLA